MNESKREASSCDAGSSKGQLTARLNQCPHSQLEGGQAMRKTRCPSSPQVTPAAWVRMDASGVIRFVSRRAELLFGYDGDDLRTPDIAIVVRSP